MFILSGVGLVVVFLAVCFFMRDRQPPLNRNDIRGLRQFSERARRESAFPFD